METLISTGLRWGEAIALNADAVVQVGRKWFGRVKRTFAEIPSGLVLRDHGKTAAAIRMVSIPEKLAKKLLASVGDDGFIFHAARGGFLLRNTFWRVLRGALKRAGLSGVRVHDLRHTHATWLLAAGVPILVVTKRLGHTKISTTSIFLHPMPGGDDPALGAVEGFGLAA